MERLIARIWPEITIPFMERWRGSCFQAGTWKVWRIKALEFMAHVTAKVPCYCGYVYSYCIKYLTYTVSMEVTICVHKWALV